MHRKPSNKRIAIRGGADWQQVLLQEHISEAEAEALISPRPSLVQQKGGAQDIGFGVSPWTLDFKRKWDPWT